MKARWILLNSDDLDSALEEIDPDWTDHFITAEQAAQFYEQDDDFIEAVEEIIEENGDDEE